MLVIVSSKGFEVSLISWGRSTIEWWWLHGVGFQISWWIWDKGNHGMLVVVLCLFWIVVRHFDIEHAKERWRRTTIVRKKSLLMFIEDDVWRSLLSNFNISMDFIVVTGGSLGWRWRNDIIRQENMCGRITVTFVNSISNRSKSDEWTRVLSISLQN